MEWEISTILKVSSDLVGLHKYQYSHEVHLGSRSSHVMLTNSHTERRTEPPKEQKGQNSKHIYNVRKLAAFEKLRGGLVKSSNHAMVARSIKKAGAASSQPQHSTPTKETLDMMAASSPNPVPPSSTGAISNSSPNLKRRVKKKKKKLKSKPATDSIASDTMSIGESDVGDVGSTGRLSGVSSMSEERKQNPLLNKLLMEIERLETQSIGSKLKEHKSRSVLTDEKRKHEGVVKEFETKLIESQAEIHQLKQDKSAMAGRISSSADSFSSLQSKISSQEGAFLGIIAKQSASHAFTKTLQSKAKSRAANSDVLNVLQDTILENEHLSEEVRRCEERSDE